MSEFKFNKYKNLFEGKTQAELNLLAAQFLEFEDRGFIRGEELSDIRNQYLIFTDVAPESVISILKKDLLIELSKYA